MHNESAKKLAKNVSRATVLLVNPKNLRLRRLASQSWKTTVRKTHSGGAGLK
jgi:hypothetical protein